MDAFLRRVWTRRSEEQAREYAPGRYVVETGTTGEVRETTPRANLEICRCGHMRGSHQGRKSVCGVCLCSEFSPSRAEKDELCYCGHVRECHARDRECRGALYGSGVGVGCRCPQFEGRGEWL